MCWWPEKMMLPSKTHLIDTREMRAFNTILAHKTCKHTQPYIKWEMFSLSLSVFISDIFLVRFTRWTTNGSVFTIRSTSGIISESTWWGGSRVRANTLKASEQEWAHAQSFVHCNNNEKRNRKKPDHIIFIQFHIDISSNQSLKLIKRLMWLTLAYE